MRIACIYWYTKSVGGIATHLNSLRTAAIQNGDEFDILHSRAWKTKKPKLFEARQWIFGGDTRIWCDGEIPQTEEAARWLEHNYDAIYFGTICPHETKYYPRPDFRVFYDIQLPKVAGITDGYWDEYKSWAEPLIPFLQGILCVQPSYAKALDYLHLGNKLKVSLAPFVPLRGKIASRSKTPLLIWPNQWKEIKGVTDFMQIVPKLPKEIDVELYSTCIRYFQMRIEDKPWNDAVAMDHITGIAGRGRANFYGNVDKPRICDAYQRAWYTVNLQGMKTTKDTYRRGSYNLTEVEAMYYGACPILHKSTAQTELPAECYLSVNSAQDIPEILSSKYSTEFALSPERQQKARQYVIDNHLASNRYQDLRNMF